jgi:hypothetical protein
LRGALLYHARGYADADAEFASEAIRLHGRSVLIASQRVSKPGRQVLVVGQSELNG